MLKFYYQWRYNRSQRISAFQIPGESRRPKINLGSYLSQDSVRGRNFDRFDLPRKHSRWLKWLFFLVCLGFLVWLSYESYQAFTIIGD